MRIVFDIETDGLLDSVTKIHCLSYCNIDNKNEEIKSITNYEDIKKLLSKCTTIIGHNIIQYDIPVLNKILDFELPKNIKIIDTLGLSWYLNDRRKSHGLETWGKELGVEKPYIEDWINLSVKEYIHRCENDVEINLRLYKHLIERLDIIYADEDKNKEKLIKYLNFKLNCLKLQSEHKIYIDLNILENSLEELEKLAQEKLSELTIVMPKKEVRVVANKPKVMYKKDGTLSSHGIRWFENLKKEGYPEDFEGDSIKVLKGYEDANPGSVQQLKDWLFLLGWIPEEYEETISKDGTINKVPKIYDDEKQVQPSIKKLYSIEPKLENLDMLGVIKHRIITFKNFKEALIDNSYVHSESKGFTSTFRLKHKKPINNLAKVHLFYGDKIRGLITIPNDDYILCGSDMCALEDTTKQHYMYYFNPDYVKEMRTPGFDPHLSMAEFANLLTSDQVKRFKELKKKEDQTEEDKSEFSDLNNKRSIAKQLNFCLPTDNTEILTPSGFKKFEDLNVGDEIFSMNTITKELEIVNIDEIPVFENVETINLKNSFFNFECTKNHRWFTLKRHRTRNKPTWYTEQFVEADNLTSEDNIIVTGKYKNESNLYNNSDIKLLAWILTEGYVKWSNKLNGKSNSKGKKRNVVCIIGQKDNKKTLEGVLSNYKYNTYLRKDGLHYYHIQPQEIRDLFNRLNLPQLNKKDIDYTNLIISMSYKQRELFINTMLLGDGHKQNNNLSEFSQNKGNILNSFLLTLTLNGYHFNLSTKGIYKGRECMNVHIIDRDHITGQKLKKEFNRKTKVFCVNNKNQTFIAKQNNKVVVTGNSCVYGAGAAKISTSIGIDIDFAKNLHRLYWERNKAVKQLASSVRIKVIFKDSTAKIFKSKQLLGLSREDNNRFMESVEELWVKNPVNNFWLSLRGLKDIFSAINQNTGVYCFDLYYSEVMKYFDIIFQYHDR